MAVERRDGPTPHGGAYSTATFTDDDGRDVPRDRATKVVITEYDESGASIFRTYGSITPAAGDDE